MKGTTLPKLFSFLSVRGKHRLIGSASDPRNHYSSDYDLNETINENKFSEKILDDIYQVFLSKFEYAKGSSTFYITDLKCGLDIDGEPLRWDEKDMKRGYKVLKNGRKMTFQECLLVKATFKLDVIALVDGSFREATEMYFLKLGNQSNYSPHQNTKGHIKAEIENDFDTLIRVDNNYFKALRRLFSLDKLRKDKKAEEILLSFFNSPIGKVNKARSDLDILLSLLSTKKFRTKDLSAVQQNIDKIADSIKMFQSPVLKSKKQSITAITRIRNRLYDFVNEETKTLF
jgi:hypothetical protein